MKSVLEIYNEAKSKNEMKIYSQLKEELEREIDGKIEVLKEYQMKCKNYKFLDFNLSVGAAMISVIALAGDAMQVHVGGVIVGYFGALAVGVSAIILHKRELKHKYMLFVLNEIEKELFRDNIQESRADSSLLG